MKTIAYKWRLVVTIILVCMLLAIPVTVVRNMKNNEQALIQNQQLNATNENDSQVLTWDNLDVGQLSQSDKQYVDNVIELYKLWKKQSDNLQSTNYENSKSGIIQYQIKSSNHDYSSADEVNSLANSLANYINRGYLINDINVNRQSSLNKNSLEYTLSCDYSGASSSLSYNEGSEISFNVYIEGEEASELLNEIENAILNYTSSLKGYENCSIAVSSESIADAMDKTTLNNRLSLQQNLNSQFDAIRNYCASFNNIQRKYFNESIGTEFLELVSEENVETSDSISEAEQLSTVSLTSNIPKNICLGIIVGFVVSVIIISLQYVMSGTVKCENDYSNLFGLYQIGNLQIEPNRDGKGARVDKFLDHIFSKDEINFEQKKQIIISRIQALIQKEQANRIFICSAGQADENFINNISQLLRNNEIPTEMGVNFIKDTKTFENAMKIGNIIFIEKLGESKIIDFNKAVNICSENKIKILGIISI